MSLSKSSPQFQSCTSQYLAVTATECPPVISNAEGLKDKTGTCHSSLLNDAIILIVLQYESLHYIFDSPAAST